MIYNSNLKSKNVIFWTPAIVKFSGHMRMVWLFSVFWTQFSGIFDNYSPTLSWIIILVNIAQKPKNNSLFLSIYQKKLIGNWIVDAWFFLFGCLEVDRYSDPANQRARNALLTSVVYRTYFDIFALAQTKIEHVDNYRNYCWSQTKAGKYSEASVYPQHFWLNHHRLPLPSQ